MSQYGFAGPYATVTIASGATLSSGIDLGKPWTKVGLKIPTMTSGTDVYLQGSTDGTTFKRIFHQPTIGNSNPGAIFVNSAVTNCIVHIGDRVCVRHLAIELSTAMTATSAQFTVVVSD